MKKIILSLIILCTLFTTPTYAQSMDEIDLINLKSRFAYVISTDENDEDVLLQRNAQAKLYPASMTKIMAVYLAITKVTDLNQTITVLDSDVQNLEGASMAGFYPGQEITFQDALYGAMIPSGADATNILARIVSGSYDSFVAKMNNLAQEIGMSNTHFVNASGLFDENHYSTAADIAKLVKTALKDDLFRQVFSTRDYTTSDGQIELSSTLEHYANGDLTKLEYISGAKSGWVPESGYCLASYSNQYGKEVIIVTGDAYESGDNVNDHNLLYRFLFETTHQLTLYKKGDLLLSTPIKYYAHQKYNSTVNEDVVVELPILIDQNDLKYEPQALENFEAPLSSDTILGHVSVKINDFEIYNQEVKLTDDIERDLMQYILISVGQFVSQPSFMHMLLILSLIVFLFILVSLFIIRRKRIRRKREGYKGYKY